MEAFSPCAVRLWIPLRDAQRDIDGHLAVVDYERPSRWKRSRWCNRSGLDTGVHHILSVNRSSRRQSKRQKNDNDGYDGKCLLDYDYASYAFGGIVVDDYRN